MLIFFFFLLINLVIFKIKKKHISIRLYLCVLLNFKVNITTFWQENVNIVRQRVNVGLWPECHLYNTFELRKKKKDQLPNPGWKAGASDELGNCDGIRNGKKGYNSNQKTSRMNNKERIGLVFSISNTRGNSGLLREVRAKME